MVKVFALGGSVLTENLDKLEEYGEAFDSFDEQVAIVTGAGKLKENILAAEELANQSELDMIGIKATRLNAETLKAAAEFHPKTPETPEEVREIASTGENFVMGGMVPGYSTDAVAATVAELLGAELYIATSTDGIYDKDPEKHKDAEKLDKVSVQKIRSMTQGNSGAGKYELIDSTALDIIERSQIDTKVFLGKPGNIEKSGGFEATELKTE